MTVDLLENSNRDIKRWYWHDLEASAWCLTYHMLKEPPSEWLDHNFSAVADAKGFFLVKVVDKVYREECKPSLDFCKVI